MSDIRHFVISISSKRCKLLQDFQATESCASLRLAGHVASGHYLLDGPDDAAYYDVTFCDMAKENEDPGLERRSELKLPQLPVAFDVHTATADSVAESVAKYTTVVVNIGDAMDAARGVFTAPVDGVYEFDFNGLSYPFGAGQTADVHLRRNAGMIALSHSHRPSASDVDHERAVINVVTVLSTGDEIDVYLPNAGVQTNMLTQFSGHLLLPL